MKLNLLCVILVAAVIPALISSYCHPEAWLVDAGSPRQGEIASSDSRLSDSSKVLRVETSPERTHSVDTLLLTEAEWDFQFEKLLSQWSTEKIVVVTGRRGDPLPYQIADRLRAFGITPVHVLREGR